MLDPDLSKDYLDRIQNRTKEKKYCFDHAFGPESTNKVPLSLSLSLETCGFIRIYAFYLRIFLENV